MLSLFKLKKKKTKPKTLKENLQNDSLKNTLDSLPAKSL